jgi:hypothetical protein
MRYRRWGGGEHHVHHVKSNLLPWHFGLPGILAGGANEAGLFLCPDGAVRRTVLVSLAGLDLHEDQRIAFPSNQIHLAGAGRQAVIAIHDDNSGALQKALGDVLAAPAEGVVVSHVPPARVLAEEVREFIEALHRAIWKCHFAPKALIYGEKIMALRRRLEMGDTQILSIALAAVPTMLAVLVGILINNSRLTDCAATWIRGSTTSIGASTRCAISGGSPLLDRFELELHHLPTHHVAQIILPKLPVAGKLIHQKLEA